MSKVSITWEDQMKFVGADSEGLKVSMDASAVYGGQNQGVRPMELMLMAVGGCTGIEVKHILNKMRISIEHLEIEVQGSRAENHPKVFETIEVMYNFTGENIPPQKVNEAIRLAEEVYCSAVNMINKAARVSYRFTINGTSYAYPLTVK